MTEVQEAPAPTLATEANLVPTRTSADLILSDDELRRTYRLAEALAMSGMWKDVKKAEAALAKIVIGRDLGLTPAQAMQGIHIVEGGIQLHYAMLGSFVRSRPGYDFRPAWIKRERPCRVAVVSQQGGESEWREGVIVSETMLPNVGRGFIVKFPSGHLARLSEAEVEVLEVHDSLVWIDEEDPLDLRPVWGAVTVFTVNGEQRGVSRFTMDDAFQANLVKADTRAAWNTSSRNMLLARSLSNGIKWVIPEVLGGMPVYAEGELPTRPKGELTAPTDPNTGDEGSGIDLGPKVEALIERATALGHRGLSNRAAVELAVGSRAPGVVNDWVVRAKAELDRFEEERKAAATADETDIAAGDPEERPVEAPPEEVTGPVEAPPVEEAPQPAPDQEPPAEAEVVDDPRARLEQAMKDTTGTGKPDTTK